MLKGVAMKGLVWESDKAILLPPFPFPQGDYHMTSNMIGDEKSKEGLNHMTSNMLGIWG